jgi:hypothetical protein
MEQKKQNIRAEAAKRLPPGTTISKTQEGAEK